MTVEGDAWDAEATGTADETLAGTSLTIRRTERALERGETLGRYVVLDRIGAGGMGVVYAAYDPELDRKIALKLVRVASRAGIGESDGGGRLLREAQAMARLAHPNVITIHDVGRLDDEVFLAMEYVVGRSLTDWLRDTEHDWPGIVAVFRAAGEGLAAAHRAGIVHRDFKPDNVLVGDDGRVRVLDFGLARRDDRVETTPEPHSSGAALDDDLTRTGAVMGTPAYMSPEQHTGLAVDARTDQFSFCVALYEALLGERPFEGSTPTALAINVIEGRLRDPASNHGIPSWLMAAVTRGLATDPADRFASMDELLGALAPAPAPRRRPWLSVGGFVGLAAAVLAYALWPSDEVTVCAGAEDSLAEAWGPEVLHDTETAFQATRKTYATATFDQVRTRLDAYANKWKDGYVGACRATRIHGTQSEAVLDLRMACLDGQKHRVAAITTVLREADERVVLNALDIVRALPDPTECSDLAALESDLAPPAPEIVDEVEALRTEVARVEAIHRAGRVSDAVRAADAMVEGARELDYAPVLAETLYTLAFVIEDSPRMEETGPTLREAAEVAVASGDRRTYVRTLTLLVRIEGYRHADFESAEWLARLAEAEIHALGDSPALLASLRSTRGTLRYTQGRYDDAIADYEAAIELHRREPDVDPLQVADLDYNVGGAFLGLGRYQEAESKFRTALDTWTRAVGPDHPDVAYCHNNLAVALLRLGKPKEAIDHARKAYEIWAASYGPTHADTASALNNLGDGLSELGRYDEALEKFQEGVRIKAETLGPDHPDTLGARSNIATAHQRAGRSDEALALFEEIVSKMTAALGPEHPKTLTARLGLADLELELGKTETALASLKAVREDVVRGPGESHPIYVDTQIGLSAAYEDLGREVEALAALRVAREHLLRGQDPARLEEVEKRITQLEK
jgi:tetratricopeptide (TPR) repeat protein